MAVLAGERRHRITLDAPGSPVADGDGGYIQTFTALSPSIMFAKIEPATARELERVAGGTVISSATHIVTIPYHAEVNTTTRITFGTRTFNVTGVANPEERNRETVMVCAEVVS